MSVAAPTAPTAPRSAAAERTITSHVLGELTLPETSFFTFPEGLHGFEAQREFALVPAARDGFWWLQCASESTLAFLLADPFLVAPGYEVDLRAGDVAFLGLASPADALVLTVVTLPAANGGEATTNLRGPVVFNANTRVARQVVSAIDGHGLQVDISLAP